MKTPLTFFLFTIICLVPFTGFSQFISLTGKITSEKDGKILENADVLECSSKTGTISDKDGFYKLILTPGNVDLLVSNEGFADYSQKLFLKEQHLMEKPFFLFADLLLNALLMQALIFCLFV